MAGGHPWKPGQHAKFTATMRKRREAKALLALGNDSAKYRRAAETKVSAPVNDKSQPEQIVYHGALYRRVRHVRVIR